MPTSLADWIYVVPSEAMEHAVLLRRDGWMRSNDRTSCRNISPFIPLAGAVELEPWDLLDNSSAALLQVPIEAVLPGTQVPAPFPCDTSVHRLTVPGPATAPADNAEHRLQP